MATTGINRRSDLQSYRYKMKAKKRPARRVVKIDIVRTVEQWKKIEQLARIRNRTA